MNFRKLGENDLSDFAANVVSQLDGVEITAIDTNVRTDLVTAIGTLPATLSTMTSAAQISEDVRKAAFTARNDTKLQVTVLMAQVRDALRAGLAPKKQYDLCGFDYPLTPPTTYIPIDPSHLSVSGRSNGVNSGKFAGNNKNGAVVYEIWRRQGDEGAWGLHMTTKKQTFTDTPVTPGQYYEYKVRAVASKSMSNYSNSAVVYGVL